MARCRKCNKDGLEWLEHVGRNRLYDPTTGKFHNEVCKVTPAEFDIMKNEAQYQTCIHGILKDRFCPLCEDARNQSYE